MIERVSDTYTALNDILCILKDHKDELADIVKLLIDEHENEKIAYIGGKPVDDVAYKYSKRIMETFDSIVDEFETSFRTICLLLPYLAMQSPTANNSLNQKDCIPL